MDDPGVLQSAVRVPTPPPGALSPSAASRKRDPSREDAGITGVESARAIERERQLADRVREHERQEAARKPLTEEEKQASAKAEYEKLLNMRSGGTYIPPARLRALQAQITDKTSKEYQRMAWEALKKSINGLINKVNVSNIKYIVPELFGENLVRGRGLFCRSIMKAQAASLPFTPIYAAMTAIVNTKLPQVGDLLLSRLIIQFRKAFKRNDKAVCISSTTFIAHLCNTQVAHEMLAAQILLLLLHKPTDDSVEIAVGLTREFRNILHEADIDKRVQYMIEVLFQVRKDRYKDNPAVKEELDLVEEEDQITHRLGLDDEIESQDTLNIFKFDPEWEKHEEAYKKLKAEILGEDSDEDEDEQDDDDESSEEESDAEEQKMDIKDQSNTDLVNLRRTIYLTIMSSIDFEECCHKLMKINLPAGLEPELPSMIIECCSQERTFSKFYGLIGERFAKINRLWSDLFEAAFAKYYDTIHRYETNRLRNIARFFGHMIGNDAIGWHVLSVVHMNEEETTSSSRIFIKILFQDLAEHMGLPTLQSRFRDEILRPSFEGLFPTDNPRYTRFSINYFTSIGMGVLTEDMREHLKNAPKPALPALPAGRSPSRSPSVRSHPASCSTCTPRSSRSPSRSRSRSHSYSRSPSRDRGRSYSRSITPSSRGRSYTPSRSRSRSPPRRSRRNGSDSRSRTPSDRSRSVSRTPPRRTRARSGSRTPSRSPYRARRSVSRSVTPPRRGHSYSRSVSRSVTPNRAPASKDATRSSVSASSRRVRDQPSRVASHTPIRRRDDSRPRQNYSQTPPKRR
ncbi:MIF4G-domain-containing protein [Penicillium frequentans]|uniref:Pre-mRNA-splicing factor CWC22 n=1 Tax=Penicillium frequentans TaxID=3151616 RepID=A0AAD6GFG7_9EURO|nr:MIF4G-domain-containing protein [Penicillium glabrum]